ncbi:MAG: hypothetical protein WAL90_08545 [Desulfobacterales bacterium]
MNPTDKRRWPRADFEMPVMYCLGNKEPFYAATTRNNSVDGLHFVGDAAMQDGESCHILIEKDLETLSCPPDFKLCNATVKWCSPLPSGARPAFAIGVQLDGWCRSLDSSEIQRIFYPCDACGETIISCDICKIDGPIYLCSKCHDRLKETPNGPLKESYLRCLCGNVI